MSSELQALVTVTLTIPAGGPLPAGPLLLGVWDKRSGGAAGSAPTIHRPGGMGPLVWYGSLATYSDWTLSRVLDNEYRTDSVLYKQVQAYVGRCAFTGVEQPLDINGNAWGSPSTAVGVLHTLDPGSYDSESEAARMWEIVAAITNIT